MSAPPAPPPPPQHPAEGSGASKNSAYDLSQNKTVRILEDAEKGGYGVLAPVAYNIEHILAFIRTAQRLRSPLILQFFPWAITFSDGLLVRAAHLAATTTSSPSSSSSSADPDDGNDNENATRVSIALHLDHCQDEALVKHAASTLPFDSIMVDMSHHARAENLARTAALVRFCAARGVAAEGECGRIEGGEDGVLDTQAGGLEGLLTGPDDVRDFVGAGVRFLAPSFGNVHGEYGARGPQLDFERLESIRRLTSAAGVKLVLHGTNSFPAELTRRCIAGGVSKVNVNKLVLEEYQEHLKEKAGRVSLTQLMEEGVAIVEKAVEEQMRICGSVGKG